MNDITLIPLRETAPVTPGQITTILATRKFSQAAIKNTAKVFLCAQKNTNESPTSSDLFNIGVLAQVQRIRVEEIGVKFIYSSLFIAELKNVTFKNDVFVADILQRKAEIDSALVKDYWPQMKTLMTDLYQLSPLCAEWDFLRNVNEDIQTGAEPHCFSQSLHWLLGNLMLQNLTEFSVRQKLLEIENPNEAIDFVRSTLTEQLKLAKDHSGFSSVIKFTNC